MRWLAVAGIAAVGVAVAALMLLGPQPQPGDGPQTGADGPQPLVASLTAQPHACSLCHYAWDVPLRFNGTVEAVEGGWRYRLTLAPVAAYNLTDVRVVPVVAGHEYTSELRVPNAGTVTRGQEAAVSFHLSRNASALHALLSADREFGRSDLRLALEGPAGAAEAVGAASVRAATLAPPGGLPPGEYVARVRYVDGAPLQEPFRLLLDVAPLSARIVPHATLEAPATFDFVLPEKPRGFNVQLRPFNEHPTPKWLLPNWGDRGELSLFVTEGAPPPPRAWTQAEIDAAWGGAAEYVFHESRQDGVIARSHDARGEWSRQARWITPPGHESPFPPLLPGTREVVAEITWQARTPVSPVVAPYFAWANHLTPTFYYPPPEVDEPGRRVYRLPVEPTWWQASDEVGGFQGFALLPLDERGTTVFDGEYGIKLTALR